MGHGSQMRGAGEPLQVVRLAGMELRLLAAGDGTEIIEQVLRPGVRWALCPQSGWTALEYFRVLDGELSQQAPDGDVTLGPGDSFSACPVDQEYLFRAESQVRLLYVTSAPVFHQYCADLRELVRLAGLVEARDHGGKEHCERVTARCMAVGRRLGLPPARLLALNYGAWLHDVGLVAVPEQILKKPGSLTRAEWAVMKRHPTTGKEMVAKTFLREAAEIIEQHHERLDGTGYPHGLRGDQIRLEAQVVAVIDSYDAMTTDRAFRPAIGHAAAVAALQRGAGAHYRPEVVQSFLTLFD